MKKYSAFFMTGLRILVGWHFLYEGISKLMTPGWTAKHYLMGSTWIFADFFHRMAASPRVMEAVDLLNAWGLTLVGLSLIVGLLARWSALAGALLLLFYFVAYPPIPGHTFGTVAEGNYLWVNKTLIELFVLLAFAVLPTGLFFGIDRLFKTWREEKAHAPVPPTPEGGALTGRRQLVRDLIGFPVLGAFAYALYKKRKWDSFEEKFLAGEPDAVSGATLKRFAFDTLADLKGQMPKGKLGDLELSRLIMGGNLIGGWAHARDMIYSSKLVKAYHTDEKVMMTLQLAEKCGVNAILTNPALSRIINKYWRETGGTIQFISDCGGGGKDGLAGGIRMSEEAGAIAMYAHGGISDRLVQEEKFDELAEALELMRSFGKPAGIGAHLLDTIQGCVDRGIKPDFWLKTLHHHNYWSAQVDPDRTKSTDFKKAFAKDPSYAREIGPGIPKVSNMYCYDPQQTIDFMESLEEPWIAFKVLAAGAIHPKDGVRYAFANGADFIALGMYDFQLVEDCNIAMEALTSDVVHQRQRRWLA